MTATPSGDATPPPSVVRAVHRAVRVPGASSPWDTIHAKVHYPARFSGDDRERLTGDVAVDPASAPLPVVVFLNGINVGPEAYGWLARQLAGDGFAVVTFTWVAELLPGQYGITCGLDMTAVQPDTYGTRPSATAVGPVLELLARERDGDGPLAGMLDLDRVVLGGHSAGATVAYENASRAWFPGLRAVFGFGGHTLASTLLGWPPDSLLSLPGEVPVLVMGGTRDGVMAGSADRYGKQGHDADPVVRTWHEAVPADAPGCLAIIDGANHFAIGHPEDPTAARGFLDLEPVGDPAQHRALLGDLVAAFLAHQLGQGGPDRLDEVLANPLLARAERR